MIAVIETGGKQYCVQPGQKLIVNRLKQNVGETVTLSDKLNNKELSAQVISHIRGAKVVSRKFRNKTRYTRVKGHRQPLSVIAFTDTNESTAAPKGNKSEQA
jgi:large subunit ribosomal protein L21